MLVYLFCREVTAATTVIFKVSMTFFLNTILTFITQHTFWAYTVVLLVSFSESLALVGLIVPGTVMMFGIGAIVATGRLGLVPVLLLAIAGAVAGDGVSFWLGHHYKNGLGNVYPFSRYPEMPSKGKAFFHKHGAKSILFGRFVGPVRPVIPVVAGMMGMKPVLFSIVNVALAGVVLFVLLVRKCYRTAGFWVMTALGGLLGVQLLKLAIHLPRPVAIYHGASSYGHAKDMVFYAPHHEEKNITLSSWQTGAWQDLPAWRIDMEGEFEQPLTFQWNGTPDELVSFLSDKGWQRPVPLNIKRFFRVFAANTQVEQLPVLPRLHEGLTERLCLLHMEKDRRLVLRLWSSDIRIKETDSPLFVGTVEEQQSYGLIRLVTLPKDSGNYEGPLSLLQQTLAEKSGIKLVHRKKPEIPADHDHLGKGWQGKVLLAWNMPRLNQQSQQY